MNVQAIDTAVKPTGGFHPGENGAAGNRRAPYGSRRDAGEALPHRRRASAVDCLLAAKPGIVIGNAISVAGAFLMAAKGRIDAPLLLATMLGVSLTVASGCVFNNCIDRDVDRKMIRTRRRVLARGHISPRIAVICALLLGMAGLSLLYTRTNPLCLAIVLTGLAIYVGAYSLGLKRRSGYAVLIGSLAGAAPPLAGYCAVTARFDLGAVILLAVFSLWQIPHAYTIAVYHREDFAIARIPVLPVTQGMSAAKRRILVSIALFAAAAIMPTLGGYTGPRFLVVAAALGLSWLGMAWLGLRADDDRRWAKRLFIFSILAISVLSLMMAVDYA
jgi:protoheme IX farnesyltransferase